MTYRYLDLTRAVAAVLVLLSHSRAFFLVDYNDAMVPRTVLIRSLYFVSGFGHQAVLVFFALSGFLISGSIIRSYENGTWSWADYALHRLTRLLVVLIPCLVITSLLDHVAVQLSHSGFYTGDPSFSYGSGPPRSGVALDGMTFLGNLLFLQTILVPVLGSNGPLWSLANEFWYYLLFPLCFLVWNVRRRPLAAVAGVAVAGLIGSVLLTPAILMLFPIWLLGFLVYVADRLPAIRRVCRGRIVLVVCAGLFGLATVAARLDKLEGVTGDIAFAACFALLMLCLLHRSGGRMTMRITGGIAAMSFTLYLVHFPCLAFAHAVFFHEARLQPDVAGVATWLGVSVAVFAVCLGLYFLFEARTTVVRHAIERLLGRSTGYPRTGPADREPVVIAARQARPSLD